MIARGHQLINAALGGHNMLNFPRKHAVEHSEGIQHEIVAEDGSILNPPLWSQSFWSTAFTGTAQMQWDRM